MILGSLYTISRVGPAGNGPWAKFYKKATGNRPLQIAESAPMPMSTYVGWGWGYLDLVCLFSLRRKASGVSATYKADQSTSLAPCMSRAGTSPAFLGVFRLESTTFGRVSVKLGSESARARCETCHGNAPDPSNQEPPPPGRYIPPGGVGRNTPAGNRAGPVGQAADSGKPP